MERLFLKAFAFALVSCGGTLLNTRLDFVSDSVHGFFKRKRWLETAILFSLLLVSYFTLRRRRQAQSTLFRLKPSLLAATAAFGALTGLANYLYPALLPDFLFARASGGLGEAAQFAVVVSSSILCQWIFWGWGEVVYYLSALLAGVGLTMLLFPATTTDSFFFLQLFRVEKAVFLFLPLWN